MRTSGFWRLGRLSVTWTQRLALTLSASFKLGFDHCLETSWHPVANNEKGGIGRKTLVNEASVSRGNGPSLRFRWSFAAAACRASAYGSVSLTRKARRGGSPAAAAILFCLGRTDETAKPILYKSSRRTLLSWERNQPFTTLNHNP